jgi:hypothetical protein
VPSGRQLEQRGMFVVHAESPVATLAGERAPGLAGDVAQPRRVAAARGEIDALVAHVADVAMAEREEQHGDEPEHERDEPGMRRHSPSCNVRASKHTVRGSAPS